MRLTHRPALAALITVVGFVVLAVTPALADPPYTFGFDAGNLHLEGQGAAPDIDVNFGVEPDEDPCDLYDPNDRTSIEVDITGAGPNYTTNIAPSAGTTEPSPTGQLSKSTVFNPVNNTWYQVDLDISNPVWNPSADNTGTLTKTGPTTWDLVQNVWIEARLYLADPPDCEKDDLVCSLIIVFDGDFSAPLTGDYTGTVAPTSGTDISDLDGQGLVFVNGECDAGLAGSYDNAPVTLSGASLSFVP